MFRMVSWVGNINTCRFECFVELLCQGKLWFRMGNDLHCSQKSSACDYFWWPRISERLLTAEQSIDSDSTVILSLEVNWDATLWL